MSLARTTSHRLERNAALSFARFRRNRPEREIEQEEARGDAVLDCGWGRLIFAHTFANVDRVVETLRGEEQGRRDIALYLQDPHVALARAPQDLFLDPSHTYRLWLTDYRPSRRRPRGYAVHRLRHLEDAQAVNRIYSSRGMVGVDPEFLVANRHSRSLSHFVAVDIRTGQAVGTVTGVDHRRAFGDPEQGSSLWCLAVDPQASFPGIGETLVRTIAEHFLARGRAFVDLSVLHDNDSAIALYEKLGFRRIQAFSVKKKNPINERLFMAPPPEEKLNPYATILVNEARRRGIGVEVVDAEGGYFCLSSGGRSVMCRESLTELTSAVAMSRCDDKTVTRRVLQKAGLSVPAQTLSTDPEADAAFLKQHGSVVVKPARGEQGRGITVDVRDPETLAAAVETARRVCETVLLEQFFEGHDLRVIVIGFEVVAAAIRRPAQVVGDGEHSVRELIESTSRRRAAATGGESRIPMDAETERCVRNAGCSMDDVLPDGTVLPVRKTANLHTGGTIHDVTAQLHPALAKASIEAARALNIPVVGLDLLIKAPDQPDHVFIEANERPGLANHEPQPTAERFIDLLFPHTKGAA
ncbi:N-acetylglutaminylglutamine synthetase [Azospirillum sp. SYSU D00513]|uniref:N-acetylglutaminylglutamine synthetase n=1 Tax=Azospirillum sp. SYSU D00513 TaxID=2812561 RepID=UPI001A978150|nr:N-acetylglutaminylglutamine synthetase [Azospirillum sp. SYSU D00513]